MAKKQTRKSISMNLQFFDRLKEFCDREDVPMAAFLEFALEGNLSAPLDAVAFQGWLATRARRAMATRTVAIKRAHHAAGLARLRAIADREREQSKTKNGDGS